MNGFVSLVGAGPGDVELLTLKAARALAAADVVFYDALTSLQMLELAPRAQKFAVGKRCGRPAIRQEAIHALLIRAARRGKRVVRLKGGDPFVFGRGGEEALALTAAGVAFEMVPGVSNAIAAPALAGIPVTHRGLASAFVVVSAHDEATFRPVLEGLAPGAATVVALMGLASRARVAAVLVERGWSAATPAAVVLGAAGPRAHTWRGMLATLGTARFPESTAGLPGTLVIGEVVSLAALIAPSRFDNAVRPVASTSPVRTRGGTGVGGAMGSGSMQRRA
jgi:uroporphyrin-III C-methyltransferase / precorrin-2 dehydrogenase / sirohydrochlorin ferrochelatase